MIITKLHKEKKKSIHINTSYQTGHPGSSKSKINQSHDSSFDKVPSNESIVSRTHPGNNLYFLPKERRMLNILKWYKPFLNYSTVSKIKNRNIFEMQRNDETNQAKYDRYRMIRKGKRCSSIKQENFDSEVW